MNVVERITTLIQYQRTKNLVKSAASKLSLPRGRGTLIRDESLEARDPNPEEHG